MNGMSEINILILSYLNINAVNVIFFNYLTQMEHFSLAINMSKMYAISDIISF